MRDYSKRDKEMAAYMKKMGIERTTQMCPLCYRIVSRESYKSRFRHMCRGGK